jgi:type II secretory pathway component GspD/PulD (secretin)
MKRFSIALSAMFITAAVAQEPAAQAKDETKGAAATPLAETATSNVDDATALQDEGTDEIDLEEDDSAIAAKKPQIKGDISEGTMSLVDIDCDDATLADILRQFRKTTGANIISDDSTNLQRRVSVSLRHVPWLQGMTAILGSRGFRIEIRDNIYRVVEDMQLIPVSTRTFKLNHASAQELADLFNATYAPKDPTGKIKSPIASSFPGANVVVVTATDKILSDCEAIITEVDKAIAQIYIEARFLELSAQAMHKLGMQWNSLESWGVSAKNIYAGIEYNNGRAANYGMPMTTRSQTSSSSNSKSTSTSTSKDGSTTSTSSSPSTSSSDSSTYTGLIPNSIGAAAGAGRTAEDMAWRNARGFSGQLSADDFRLALSAFESLGEGKIFSNPKVIVSNGKEAHVDMTTKFPNVELTSQRNTSTTTPYTDVSTKISQIPGDKGSSLFAGEVFYSWGITLTVKPRISPDGLISVVITPTISQLDTSVSSTGFYQVQNSSSEIDVPYSLFPIIDMKRIETEFTMKDGATAVIGGLSRTVEDDVDSGIPYLRKIPWIGPKLFGWKSRQKVQKEIIVCVTVGIADPADLPKDAGLPKNAILGREFVRGIQFEPGDREGVDAKVLKLDMTELDKREGKKAKGKVTITPISEPVQQEPAPEAKAKEPAPTVEPAKAEEPAKVEEVPAAVEPAKVDVQPQAEEPAKEENLSELQKLSEELKTSDNQ